MFLSIVIPVYNAEKYIRMAVVSIMNQTYRNLEILIADDCSSDETWNILCGLAEQDSRIVLERNQENMKIVKTLNKLVEKAEGKYIARMDADDISDPARIMRQVELLEENSLVGICGTGAWRINEENRIIGRSFLPHTPEDIRLSSSYYSVFYHPSVMLRSKLYKENLYDEGYLYAEDMELWQRILRVTQGVNLKERLLYYRLLKSSASNSEQSRNIQRQLSNKLCDNTDFETLRRVKSKSFVGMVLWSKARGRSYVGSEKAGVLLVCNVIHYLLIRIFDKIVFSLLKRSVSV